LARILKRQDLCIDVFELRIAVGMLRAFLGFPVDLPAIPEPFEQLRNAARRNLMAHLTQRRRELGVALGSDVPPKKQAVAKNSEANSIR
jgi:hypothetical protein